MIFVDTGAFVARYRRSDSWHRTSVDAWKVIARRGLRCFTTPFVFAEATRLLRPFAGARQVARLITTWLDLELLTVLRPNERQEREAVDLMHKYADQEVGFVDCVSFVMMKHHRLTSAFSFDRHFQVAGFELWPATGVRGRTE